ncbi:MAG: SPOR domain-containing protein [Calothrix sp. MO_167.B12]|nr:SPOR domain-containing protein [Calothrix sp. MO_167.B12]
MSDNPRLNPSDSSSKPPGLNPVLATALASLEVQLDQELARYRRTRIGSRTPNSPRIANSMSSQSLGLHLFTPTENQTGATPTTQPTNQAQPQARVTESVKTEGSEQLQSPTTAKTPATSSNSSSIVPTPVQRHAPQETSDGEPPVGGELSVANTNISDATSDRSQEPDDYLESSEALLRSLTEEKEQKSSQEKPKNTGDGLLSPLGIGSMLLLLVASLTLGYGLFNPKSLPKFSLNGLFQGQASKTGENTSTQPQTQLSPIPKHPNLAAEEFPEINNSNDIVGLNPKTKPTPIVKPTPVIPPNPPKSTTVAVTQVKSQPKAKPTPTPKNTPKPQASQPSLAQIKPSADGFYHVVTDNQGENAFTKARGIVGDAYLSDDKKMIYLGAVKSKARAKNLLQQLKAKGLNARIKQP